MTAEKSITQLYIGYLGRAADRDGLAYWRAQAGGVGFAGVCIVTEYY